LTQLGHLEESVDVHYPAIATRLSISLRSAKNRLGLSVPISLLGRADEVIE